MTQEEDDQELIDFINFLDEASNKCDKCHGRGRILYQDDSMSMCTCRVKAGFEFYSR